MPLPFLAAAAVIGVGSIIGAAAKSVNNDYEDELNSINFKAEELARNTEDSYRRTQIKTEEKLDRYILLKNEIFETTLKEFVQSFRKIKNVELSNNTALMEKVHMLETLSLDFENNATAYRVRDERTEAIKGAVLGSVLGGAYLVGSVIKGVRLQYAIDEAKANFSKLKVEAEKVKKQEMKLKLIGKRADELASVMNTLNQLFRLAIHEMNKNISAAGTDYGSYNQKQREQVFLAVQFAEAVKKLLDVSIVSPTGETTSESKAVLEQSQSLLVAR
jgi:hypothetical protein